MMHTPLSIYSPKCIQNDPRTQGKFQSSYYCLNGSPTAIGVIWGNICVVICILHVNREGAENSGGKTAGVVPAS